MESDEKRKSERIDSHNLISYVCYDEHNEEEGQGMGRTLNVSRGGITLETHNEIKSPFVELTIGLEDDIIEIKGRVIYCKKNENDKFATGIEFMTTDKAIQTLDNYIAAFHKQKKEDES